MFRLARLDPITTAVTTVCDKTIDPTELARPDTLAVDPRAGGRRRAGPDPSGTARRRIVGSQVLYGAAFGGFAGALCAVPDGVVVAATGHYIPWALPPLAIATYAVLGALGGAMLGAACAWWSRWRPGGVDWPSTRASIQMAWFAAYAGVFGVVFLQRLLHGWWQRFSPRVDGASITVLVACLLFSVWLATGRANRRWACSSVNAWRLSCVALFGTLWNHYNDLYEAAAFSMTSFLGNAAYLLLAIGVYFLGRVVVRRLARRNLLDDWASCSRGAVGVGAVGLACSWCALWAVMLKPIDVAGHSDGGGAFPVGAARPNVVLIVMDTTRADHLSVYGYAENTTPNLAALAEEATCFTRAVAPCSRTLESHASLFTGLLPTEHGVHWRPPEPDAPPGPSCRLAEAFVTLAETLQANSYSTAAVVGNAAMLHRSFGFNQGFEYYDDRSRRALASARPRTISPALWFSHACQWLTGAADGCRYADEVNASVFAWLDRQIPGPRFLFINYMDPHSPYRAHPQFHGRLRPYSSAANDAGPQPQPNRIPPEQHEAVTNYDAEIAFLDIHLGRLFDKLKAVGLFDSSLIIVTGDHGEAFGERGFTEHGNTLFEEEIRVPLLIRYPGGGDRMTVDTPTSLVTLMPTILNQVGIHAVPLTSVTTRADAPAAIAELHFPRFDTSVIEPWVMRAAYTDAGVKIITAAARDGSMAVYDLPSDPHEQHDLSAQQADLARRVDAWLTQWEREARPADRESVMLSEDLREQLRSLGYLR
ncbi:MAG: sulfatase [Phycisphaerales bacterium]|nr:MAG: sulfatase [Phycisphaerales bacterium]